MDHKALAERPINRISHVLLRIKKVWHYHPQLTLEELVSEITLNANKVKSELPETTMFDIEDVAYLKGHFLHESRHLEMGINAIEKKHEGQPLPPAPIQTALLGRIGDYWRSNSQMRLGQLLSNARLMATMKAENQPD